jgi:hypothetical protein
MKDEKLKEENLRMSKKKENRNGNNKIKKRCMKNTVLSCNFVFRFLENRFILHKGCFFPVKRCFYPLVCLQQRQLSFIRKFTSDIWHMSNVANVVADAL